MFSMVSYGKSTIVYLSFQIFSVLDFGHFNTFKYIVKWGTNSCNLCVTLKLKTVLKTVLNMCIFLSCRNLMFSRHEERNVCHNIKSTEGTETCGNPSSEAAHDPEGTAISRGFIFIMR